MKRTFKKYFDYTEGITLKKKLKIIIPTIICTILICISINAIAHAETENTNLDTAIRLLQKAHDSRTKAN